MITDEIKEQIKEAADLVEVISDKVKLKRSGNGFTGLCPFHNEKTPSFHVSPHLGIYKCFGCGRAGDVFNFVMESDGMSFPEAMRVLADRYHVFIPETENETENPVYKQKEGIFHALKFASVYYHHLLRESEEGAQARSYLIRRGLSRETIKEYVLGYSIDSYHGLIKEAKSAGIDEQYLYLAGLVKDSQQRKEPYDTFRDRIMYPIFNPMGRVIGFGGRLMGDAKVAKYINSPQTEVYNKSEVLYGIHVAKNEIRKHQEAILVEGYMDVLQLHQAGIKNVISTSGTAFTPEQAKVIHRYGEKLVAIFDADKAGQNATHRSIPIVLSEGMGISLLRLPENEDPDTFIKQFGKESFLKYKQKNEVPFIDYLVKTAEASEEWENPHSKKKVISRIIQLIALLKDAIIREAMIQKLHELTGIGDRALFDDLAQTLMNQERKERVDRRIEKQKEQATSQPESAPTPPDDRFPQDFPEQNIPFPGESESPYMDFGLPEPPKRNPKYEEELLRLIFTANMERPDLMLMFVSDFIRPEYFESEMCRTFYKDILNRFLAEEPITIASYLEREDPFPVWLGQILIDPHSISEKGNEMIRANQNEQLQPYKLAKSSMRSLEVAYCNRQINLLSDEIKNIEDRQEKARRNKDLVHITLRKSHILGTRNNDTLYPNPEWLKTE